MSLDLDKLLALVEKGDAPVPIEATEAQVQVASCEIESTTPVQYYGASPDDWDTLSLVAGLTEDLLTVVSNPNATISPKSEMKGIGKTPSLFNPAGQVVGIPKWTEKKITLADITRWQGQDYSICIQTRRLRGVDVDVSDPVSSLAIRNFLTKRLEDLGKTACVRSRSNSAKFLVAFYVEGSFTKRILKVQGGMIEFLAAGQQFIAVGTHTSGVRYEWEGGLPHDFPLLPPVVFETLWADLASEFGVGEHIKPIARKKPTDPLALFLESKGWVRSFAKDGMLNITCPFEHEHTDDTSESATQYRQAHTGGYQKGHFNCKHAHCAGRTDGDFINAVGYVADDFGMIVADIQEGQPLKFQVIPAKEFSERKSPEYLIKDVIPKAPLTVVYAESGVGKTFFVLDAAMAIARGIAWRGLQTKQGKVVYVAAEGGGGFSKRLKAYAHHHQIDLADTPFGVIASAPNFLQVEDVAHVLKAIEASGTADLIVVDTLAQVTPGANENAGEDMGRVLSHCKKLHEATGAAVVVIHHAGKDPSRGARGWSGIRAAADAEIEITRTLTGDKLARITKQKDGEDGLEFYFALRQMPIGVDEEGGAITSCVVVGVEKPIGGVITKRRKLGANELTVLEVVGEFAKTQSEGIEVDAVIAEALRRMPRDKKGNARTNIKRALNKLADENVYFYVDESGCIGIIPASDLEIYRHPLHNPSQPFTKGFYV